MANLKTNCVSFLILLLSLQHLFPFHVTTHTPVALDDLAINCGSTQSHTRLNNRNWVGDVHSNLLSTIEPQNHPSLTATAPYLPPSASTIPFSTTRLSRSEFSYSLPVTHGPKLLRLYFYPAPYPAFHRHNSLFSVKAGPCTLLKDFNASLHADNGDHPSVTLSRGYRINVEPGHNLNITFSPSSTTHPQAYAFINGIEVVSLPNHLYHTKPCTRGNRFKLVEKDIALETVNSSGSNSSLSPASKTKAPSKTSNKNTTIPIVASVIAGTASIVVLLIIGFLIFRCLRRAAARGKDQEPSDTCRHFSIEEIRAATNNFDDGLIVGRGGFGNVYKGHIDKCHAPVAVKRLKPGSEQGAHEFRTEIEMLSQFRHPHLVSLIGYCNDGGEMILVYDFMARGTLCDHLYGAHSHHLQNPLSWIKRLEICLEAARGLHFLHDGVNGQSVIHRDVKSSNILLDENWVAKVSDFGLSRVGPNGSHVTTDVKGSFGYLDPEYYMSLWLTQKSDVYSFGVVLLEVLCGRPPIKSKVDKRQEVLVAWVKRCFDEGRVDRTMDPALRGTIRPKCLKKFVEVAMSCLHDHGKQRPLMCDVVKGLECALNMQRGGAHVRGKGKGKGKGKGQSEDMEMGLTKIEGHEEFEEKFRGVEETSSSKATTTCSEEEQALVRGVSSELGNPIAR